MPEMLIFEKKAVKSPRHLIGLRRLGIPPPNPCINTFAYCYSFCRVRFVALNVLYYFEK